ncbi:MAG: Rne/Rng family ribonuclease, partial [Eubacteriaceae bacterium]|nr:Rne/Rng family ribonuclease [Eubacteriaceae bacterium]
MNRIIVETMMGQNRIAVTEEGQLTNFFIDRETDWNNYGDIYLGRVEQIKPGMQIAFVKIGSEKNALLHLSDIYPNEKELPIDKVIKRGQDIVVQVKKEAVGEKGARLTTKYWISGHFIVLLPTEEKVYISKKIKAKSEIKRLKDYVEEIKPVDVGVIIRTESEGASFESIEKELLYLIDKWRRINGTIHTAPKLLFKDNGLVINSIRDFYTNRTDEVIVNSLGFQEEITDYFNNYFPEDLEKVKLVRKLNLLEDMGIEKQIEQLYARKLWLKSGGYIIIDHTEAFTVIDVNSGKFTGTKNPEETILKINLEATEVIADQMRLRNISGIILIDYINIQKDREKDIIMKKWKEMALKDKVRFKVFGFTELSIMQITRKQE